MISKNAWIIVGILLWGLPTGLLVSIMVAFVKPTITAQEVQFSQKLLESCLYIFLPLFALFGMIFGILMHKIGEKCKNE